MYLYFTAEREADKNSVCSIPEIMEILPDDKLRHIKEKGKMNGAHPCFTSYTRLLSAAQIPEKQSCCLFFWLLLPGPYVFHIKQLWIRHKSSSGCWRLLLFHLCELGSGIWSHMLLFSPCHSEYCVVFCLFSYLDHLGFFFGLLL